MTVDTRDILLKAAEDVQSGMWCKGDWFVDLDGETSFMDRSLFAGSIQLEAAQSMLRCAEGSIALSTRLLGGDVSAYAEAINAVDVHLPQCPPGCKFVGGLAHFNDSHLPDDPFEAGQQLAELFRTTAESL